MPGGWVWLTISSLQYICPKSGLKKRLGERFRLENDLGFSVFRAWVEERSDPPHIGSCADYAIVKFDFHKIASDDDAILAGV